MRLSLLTAASMLSAAASAVHKHVHHPRLSCNNAGLSFAEYTSPAGNNPDSTYSTFDPTAFKTLQPNQAGTTYTVGGWYTTSDSTATGIYGSPQTFTSNAFAVAHRGYFIAPASGTYTLTTYFVDDILLVWLGPTAYSGFTRQNAVLSNTWNNYAPTYSFSANQGDYIPIRLLFGQGYGAWGMSLSILGPNGTNILTSGQSSMHFCQFGCNAKAATSPPFAAWGSES